MNNATKQGLIMFVIALMIIAAYLVVGLLTIAWIFGTSVYTLIFG